MKVFFKTLIFASVLTVAGTVENVQAVIGTIQIAQTQKAAVNAPIPLALPTTADVVLKNGSSMTGQVTAFDPNKQIIQISRSSVSRSLQIAQIQRVIFKRDGIVYTSDGRQLPIRGEDNSQAQQSIWKNIPLNAFRFLNPSRGQASVDLATLMNPRDIRGIRGVAVKSLYVADEIQFQTAGKMTIKVTPTDP
jgi:small nuclear ribonucleoprotein (snRNP)-like protein